MGNKKLCLVRAPYGYKYSSLSVKEEPIITYLMGYLSSIGFIDYYVFDFHLVRETLFEHLLIDDITDYIIAVRETGENVHYVRRLAKNLSQKTNSRVWIYGQVARLKHFTDWGANVRLVHHSERELASQLGLRNDGLEFTGGLTAEPYFHALELSANMKRRAKASLETTRGCHFACSFCFINQGKNYDSRWQIRPNDAILEDIRKYYQIGIRNFVFYDSEFIGRNEHEYDNKRRLLENMSLLFPSIKFKIYARADTLLKFNSFSLLKKAGLVQVFVGAESLSQNDLNSLNKGLDVTNILDCIKQLKDQDIYINLSFIVFNRNTSLSSIAHNLQEIETLLKHKHHLLGVPTFTFSFESNWKKKTTQEDTKSLSDKTYVLHDLRQKEQPLDAEIFNPELEALMEIYRLLSYEWSKKLVSLNIANDTLLGKDLELVHNWFNGLSVFCLGEMNRNLHLFQQNLIDLDNLNVYSEMLFQNIQKYYNQLPLGLRNLETYESHAKSMSYSDASVLVEEDEYWLNNIPN